MATFTTTQTEVTFTDTDGAVSFTATRPAVTFTAGYQSVPDTSGGGGGSNVDQSSFIYHPSGTAGDITYTSWSALMTDLAASHEPRKHIYFAESVTLPTGAHDLHGATLHGNGVFGGTSNGGITVTFPTGCTITNPATVLAEGGIVLYSTSTAAVMTIATADSVYLENDALVCAKTAAFFDVTATGGAQVLFAFVRGSGFVLPSTVLIAGGDYEALDHSSGEATCIVAMPTGNQTFADDTIRGSVIIVVQSAASGTSGYPETATGLSHVNGSVFVIRHAQAFNIGYQQGTPGDWTTDPTVVSDALDELAARSSGGGGTAVGMIQPVREAGTTRYDLVPATITGAVSTYAIAAHSHYFPFVVQETITVDRLRCNVQTAAAAGKLLQMGIWEADADFQPGAVVYKSSTIAADSTGEKTATPASPITLTPGPYLLIFASNGTPTMRYYPTQQPYLPLISGTDMTQSWHGWVRSGTPTLPLSDTPGVWNAAFGGGWGHNRCFITLRVTA